MDYRRVLMFLVLIVPTMGAALQGGPVYTSIPAHPVEGGACYVDRVRIETVSGKMWCCPSGTWTACGSAVDADGVSSKDISAPSLSTIDTGSGTAAMSAAGVEFLGSPDRSEMWSGGLALYHNDVEMIVFSGSTGDAKMTTIQLLDVQALPNCLGSGDAGRIVFTHGGVGVKDTLRICAKDAGNAYAWRTLY